MATARGSGLTRAAKAKAAGIKNPRHESEATRARISASLKRYYADHPRRGHETASQKAAERAEKANQRTASAREKAAIKAARLKAAAAKRLAAAKAAQQKKAARAALVAQKAADRATLRLTQAAQLRANRIARAEHAVAKSALKKAIGAAQTNRRHSESAGRHHFAGRSGRKALISTHMRRNLKGTLHVHRRRSRVGLLHKTTRHHRTHHAWRRGRRR